MYPQDLFNKFIPLKKNCEKHRHEVSQNCIINVVKGSEISKKYIVSRVSHNFPNSLCYFSSFTSANWAEPNLPLKQDCYTRKTVLLKIPAFPSCIARIVSCITCRRLFVAVNLCIISILTIASCTQVMWVPPSIENNNMRSMLIFLPHSISTV